MSGDHEEFKRKTVTILDRSPYADQLLPRTAFDPAERLKNEPAQLPRQIESSLGQQLNLIRAAVSSWVPRAPSGPRRHGDGNTWSN